MFKLVEVSYLENWVNDNVEFIDCENNKKIQFDGYKIKIFKMLHNNLDAYGFSIEKDKVKVGFTGDTSICNSVYKLIRASKTIFIDSSSPSKNNIHLCANEVLELAKEFTDTKFYPVHMSPSSKPLLEEKIELPYQGQVIIIK